MMGPQLRVIVVGLLGASCLWACGSEDEDQAAETGGSTSMETSPTSGSEGGDSGTSNGTSEQGLTYHRDVRPLVDIHCMSCHREGGVGPFELGYNAEEWASGPAWWTVPAVEAIVSGDMPPWSAEEGCRDVVGSRAMSEADLNVFLTWRDLGFPEGEPADYAVPEGVGTFEMPEPDILVDAGQGFVPNPAEPDDFQCLVMDYTFPQKTYVQGIHVVPDEEEIVHHALVYAVNPEESGRLDELDAADPDTGYTCFGGPGTASRELLMVWIPGVEPILFDEGTAFAME
ncbi:MAG: hypothetical protein AAFS10_16190, partial [Myxococcota bacterium]